MELKVKVFAIVKVHGGLAALSAGNGLLAATGMLGGAFHG